MDLLGELEAKRSGKYSLAIDKNTIPINKEAATHTPWLIWLILVGVLLSNLALTFRLFSIQRSYADENHSAIAKLNKIEALLTGQSGQMLSFSGDIKELNSDLATVNSKIAELEQKNAARLGNIEYLDKAQNALFKKVASLEIAIDKINSATNAQ